MTKLKALEVLLGKVKAGSEFYCPSKGFHLAMGGKTYEWEGQTKGAMHVGEAYRGSLDAAKALHDAVLPEWIVHRLGQRHGNVWETCLFQLDREGWHSTGCLKSEAWSANPARSWLIAIIKALIAIEKGQTDDQ